MARPRVSSEPRRVKSVRLPDSILMSLKRAAHDRGLSENRLVEWAINDLLLRLDREDRQPRLDLWAAATTSSETSLGAR